MKLRLYSTMKYNKGKECIVFLKKHGRVIFSLSYSPLHILNGLRHWFFGTPCTFNLIFLKLSSNREQFKIFSAQNILKLLETRPVES